MNDKLQRRIRNYEVKLRLGAAGRLTEPEIQRRVANYSAAVWMMEPVIEQARQVLCSHGVSTVTFPYYLAFARELYKLTRQELSVESQRCELAAFMAKWVARGLDRAVLVAIASDVFFLAPPEPSSE